MLRVLHPGVLLARFGDPVFLGLRHHAADHPHDAAQDAAHHEGDPADGETARAAADGVFERELVDAVPAADLVEQRHEAPHQEHDGGQQHDAAADDAHHAFGANLLG